MDNLRRFLRFFVALALLFGVVPQKMAFGADQDIAYECMEDTDCGEDEFCDSGVCTTVEIDCNTCAPCPPGYSGCVNECLGTDTCTPDGGNLYECNSDSDCDDGMVCVSGECITEEEECDTCAACADGYSGCYNECTSSDAGCTCDQSCASLSSDETDSKIDSIPCSETEEDEDDCEETYYKDCVEGTCAYGYECEWADEQSSCTTYGNRYRSRIGTGSKSRDCNRTCSGIYTSGGCSSAGDECSGCSSWGSWSCGDYEECVISSWSDWSDWSDCDATPCTPATKTCTKLSETCVQSCSDVDSDETDEQTIPVDGPDTTDTETTGCEETYYKDCVVGTCKSGYDCTWADEQSSCTATGTKSRSRPAYQTCKQNQKNDCIGSFTSGGCASADDDCSGCDEWGGWYDVGDPYDCSITSYDSWGDWGACQHTECTPPTKTCTKLSEECRTACTEVASTETTTKTESCSLTGCTIANGTCTYSGCTEDNVYQCSTNFTGGSGNACSSGGDTCSGCKNGDYSTYKSTSRSCGNCTKNITCNPGYYLKSGACVQCSNGWCPGDNTVHSCPSGYPNVDAGATAITDCYSNTKQRTWSGKQIECDTPSGCESATCESCSRDKCNYVAYSNSAGTGDGTIKSGCSTNNESCKKTVKSVTASSGNYVDGITCPSCSTVGDKSFTLSQSGNTGGSGVCYKNCTQACTQQPVPTGAQSVTHGTTSTSGTYYYGGSCSAASSTCSLKIDSCKVNYWLENGVCNACDSGYSSPAGSTSESQCTKSCSNKCSGNATSSCPANAS
ncbi:MAG: hypothetical protein E7011_04560, partial [Alphaproteobacteria bacterium]|nr:hypothetical protein [Alphaproteobacteria bacterium]